VRSVANLTRRDAHEFLALVGSGFVRSVTRAYPLDRANDALEDLRAGRLNGAAVRRPRGSRSECAMRFGLAVAIIAVTLATSSAGAQEPVGSLEEVQKTLRPGDRIRVDDGDGTMVDGHFGSISGSSLRLLRQGAVIELPETQISRIRRTRRESDGILIGLGLGAAAGLSYVVLQCSGSSESGDCRRAGSVIMIGPSALAGALVDRALRRFDTVFDRTAASSTRVRLAPIVTRRRTGVALTLAY
jgi:hypothetical protein